MKSHWSQVAEQLTLKSQKPTGKSEALKADSWDHRESTRTVYLNPVLSFLYWKMEYHVTHHMFPTVPSYNLDKLHHHIKDQLPRT